jgi:hypothetical protein
MNEVKFKNTRFNPNVTPFHGLAKQMAQTVGYTADLDIDKELTAIVININVWTRLKLAQRETPFQE